jgi:hypothetical protein
LQKQSSRPLKNNNNKRDKNLEKFGVQELTTVEQRELEGGWIQLALAIAGACIYLYNEGGSFMDGAADYRATH